MTPDEIAKLPYRPCVGVMLINQNGDVFVGQRKDLFGYIEIGSKGFVDIGRFAKRKHALGEGEMDFGAIKAALDEVGFEGIAAVELAWESDFKATRPLREPLKLSREHIRETMGW